MWDIKQIITLKYQAMRQTINFSMIGCERYIFLAVPARKIATCTSNHLEIDSLSHHLYFAVIICYLLNILISELISKKETIHICVHSWRVVHSLVFLSEYRPLVIVQSC